MIAISKPSRTSPSQPPSVESEVLSECALSFASTLKVLPSLPNLFPASSRKKKNSIGPQNNNTASSSSKSSSSPNQSSLFPTTLRPSTYSPLPASIQWVLHLCNKILNTMEEAKLSVLSLIGPELAPPPKENGHPFNSNSAQLFSPSEISLPTSMEQKLLSTPITVPLFIFSRKRRLIQT